jgi:hypothetical protein
VIAPALGHEETVDPLFGWGEPQTVVFGSKRYINIAKWNEQHEDCADDISESFSTAGQGCTQRFTWGDYLISDWYTCLSKSKRSCRAPDGSPTSFVQGNDTIRVLVEEGDSITIEVKFIDWDDASDNDVFCEDSVVIDSMTLEEWADVSDLSFTLADNNSNGGCVIEGTVNAVP